MLDVLAFVALRGGYVFAQRPQLFKLRQRLRDHRIPYPPIGQCLGQHCFQPFLGRLLAVQAADFQQHIPGQGGVGRIRFKRQPASGDVLQHQLHRRVRDQLEGGQLGCQPILGLCQQCQCLIGRFQLHQRCHLASRLRVELQHGRRDDAQRALGADEQVTQVIAGIVLAQPVQAMPDLAVGRHYLQSQAQLAHVAVAQHLHPAGVGGQVAADGAAAF